MEAFEIGRKLFDGCRLAGAMKETPSEGENTFLQEVAEVCGVSLATAHRYG